MTHWKKTPWHSVKQTAKAPENRPSQKETIVFQPSMFGCHVSFRMDIFFGKKTTHFRPSTSQTLKLLKPMAPWWYGYGTMARYLQLRIRDSPKNRPFKFRIHSLKVTAKAHSQTAWENLPLLVVVLNGFYGPFSRCFWLFVLSMIQLCMCQIYPQGSCKVPAT